MAQKIILTGFGPFRGHEINASWESAKLVPDLWKNDKFKLVVEEIPVLLKEPGPPLIWEGGPVCFSRFYW